MGQSDRSGATPRPGRRAVKYCPYCGQPFAAREIWPHRRFCDRNPKNLRATRSYTGGRVGDLYRSRKLSRYGLTISDYDRMFAEQGGVCKICGRPPDLNGHPNQRYLSVDHAHTTNAVRGLLCSNCNHGIGKFKDSPDLLIRAALYLDPHTSFPTLS